MIHYIDQIDSLLEINNTINLSARITESDCIVVRRSVYLRNKNYKQIPFKILTVNQDFDISNNELTTIENLPTNVGMTLDLSGNLIVSLEGIHNIVKSCTEIRLTSVPVKSGGIGLLLVDGLQKIRYKGINFDGRMAAAFEIIDSHLDKGKNGLLACQEELIEAGLESYAEL